MLTHIADNITCCLYVLLSRHTSNIHRTSCNTRSFSLSQATLRSHMVGKPLILSTPLCSAGTAQRIGMQVDSRRKFLRVGSFAVHVPDPDPGTSLSRRAIVLVVCSLALHYSIH